MNICIIEELDQKPGVHIHGHLKVPQEITHDEAIKRIDALGIEYRRRLLAEDEEVDDLLDFIAAETGWPIADDCSWVVSPLAEGSWW